MCYSVDGERRLMPGLPQEKQVRRGQLSNLIVGESGTRLQTMKAWITSQLIKDEPDASYKKATIK